MTRTRFEDDDQDDSRPPARSTNSPTVLVLAVGGVLVALLVACAGGAVWLLGFQRQRDVRAADERIAAAIRAEQARLAAEKETARQAELGPVPRVVGERPVLGRTEFEAAVRGKTRAEVVAAVGPPDDVREKVYVEERPPGRGGPGTGANRGWLADYLIYRGRVRDDATGRPFAEATVRFGPTGQADRFEYR